jgi:hypothetical protein
MVPEAEKDGLKQRLAEIAYWDLTGQFLLVGFPTNVTSAGAVCDQKILVFVLPKEKSKQIFPKVKIEVS